MPELGGGLVELPLKPHFVLVHGISGGSWCWYKIRCLMENSGYRASCVDLKSAGIDRSDADSVLTFDDYNEPLMKFMSALPENEQVILVGHSAGGMSVTWATQKFAKKIRLAVYIAATMLKRGYWTDQDVKDGVPDLSEYGDVYELGFGLGNDKPPTSAVIKKEFQRKIGYHMSPQEKEREHEKERRERKWLAGGGPARHRPACPRSSSKRSSPVDLLAAGSRAAKGGSLGWDRSSLSPIWGRSREGKSRRRSRRRKDARLTATVSLGQRGLSLARRRIAARARRIWLPALRGSPVVARFVPPAMSRKGRIWDVQ
ncbi:hypothetical protein L484_002055 [Morus notabilis]|uniref:AB hydrolase-1 domain-containing protein n=1 Tax=Morus notabilis TaxID=981085 RepID=W9RTQ5_9ROSA|nr:hypothetical protein L484_002055 [Morus notabilis]